MRWRLSSVVRRSLHSPTWFPIAGCVVRRNTTLLELMKENLPGQPRATTPPPPPTQTDILAMADERRLRFQQSVDKRIKGRTESDLADACRSLLYGKRYPAAERLFHHHLYTTPTNELDVDFCNVFVEHYLFQQADPEKAADILRRLDRRATLDTHLLFVRDGLQKRDFKVVKEHLGRALEVGVPATVILSLPMWSQEERLLLQPLLSISIASNDSAGLAYHQLVTSGDRVTLTTADRTEPIGKEQEERQEMVIARTKSQLGGIDLLADISGIFKGVSKKCEAELLQTQARLEEASMSASQHLEHRRRALTAKMTGMPRVEGMYGLLTEWTGDFADWLRAEMERRLERGFNGPASTTPLSIDDAAPFSQCDADYFCALLAPLPPEKIALMTVSELLSIKSFDASLGGVKVVAVAKAVGQRCREEMVAQLAVSKPFLKRLPIHPKMVKQMLMGWHGRRRVENAVQAAMVAMAATQERLAEQSQEAWLPTWSASQSVQLGTWLVSCALSLAPPGSSSVPTATSQAQAQAQTQPFHHAIVYDYRTGHRQGIIRPSQKMLRQLLSATTIGEHPQSIHTLSVTDPWALPMLVPPRPWLTLTSGGYIQNRAGCVRLKDDPMHAEVLRCADAEGLLETVKRGLDALGQTAWSVNADILQLQVDMWNDRIDPRTLLPFPSHSPSPPPRPPKPATTLDKVDPQTRLRYISDMQQWQRQRATHIELVSAQCDSNYKLEIAKMFSNAQQFYMPHSVDFRGRAYTIPPHLSHIASDAARGLLWFAEAKELGRRGLFWLKVHLANLHGFDKASMEERAQWSEERVEVIKETARSPKTSQFWKDADDPWQCLAACIELTRALEFPGGPERYPCKLPIQQDGSCNGLQHYAALGRDPEGAAKVNLAPSDRPQDVYRSVADLVQLRLQEDVKPTSLLTPDELLVAQKLVNKVTRKIVKTTVMTNVYGVTEYGAREQLSLRLQEAGLFTDTAEHHLLLVARSYLAKLVFASLKELFVRAKAIQEWLTAAAVEIVYAVPVESARLFGFKEKNFVSDPTLLKYRRPVMERWDWKRATFRQRHLARYPQTMVAWTTPLHFPVIQPYSRARHVRLHTALQNVSVRSPTLSDPVDPTKQAAAFPPNFVHSLDASHMFMTALECDRRGITFASVHDCFWTHAATVDDMSAVIREQFVELYSEDVLSKLREEFGVRYRGYVVPVRSHDGKAVWRPIHFSPVPARGPFDLSSVLQSQYFFS